ncbi:Gfo/Idh/MocA family protein [Pseudalkalibacillus sp. R45]|uniref:Gfo/Idh/MocA family protein n=1 Tax=Pseudalkalibacillus sp. R45 TaxID=3457433 RepID=UPI003FCC46F0
MRIYLIGAGFIAKTHAEATMKLPDHEEIELKVADPNPSVLKGFTDQYPNAVPFSDTDEMLAEKARSDDIVIVCTPPFLHFELSKQALQSGRHVLCEKPLVMNQEESDELYEIANAHAKFLGCCSSRFIGLSKNKEIKRLIRSGVIGDVYKVSYIHRGQRSRPGIEYQPESRWFLDRSKSGGGVVMDWGPYDFAILNDLFNPTSVDMMAAWTSRPQTQTDPVDVIYDVEGHGSAMMRYEYEDKQIMVHYERASCTHGKPYHHVEIEGTKGALEWSPYFESDTIIHRFDKDGDVKMEEKEMTNDSDIDFMDHPLYHFYLKVTRKPSQAVTNEQARFNFACLQALYNCADTGAGQRVTHMSSESNYSNV